MSNEITINVSMAYEDTDGTEASLEIVNETASVTSKKITRLKQSIATSETAIDLGGITSPRWCMIVNRDTVNYVEVKVAASGAIFARLEAGMPCLVPLGSGAQAPVAIANSDACLVDVLIANA